jgi:carbamoyl-phosphate synthase large subunit
MNPRVSRSSALASKATGFPIAKIAAKLAVGYTLDELANDITKKTPACFEPTIDYVVVKVPRFTFEKFRGSDPTLGIQMKSVGETMAIGRTFKEALQKGLRGLEVGKAGWEGPKAPATADELRRTVGIATPDRIFQIKAALQAGISVDDIAAASKIDAWFLEQMRQLVEFERELSRLPVDALSGAPVNAETRQRGNARTLLLRAKQYGFSDRQLAGFWGMTDDQVRRLRIDANILPAYYSVDTCAAEFEAYTPYFYSTYESPVTALTRLPVDALTRLRVDALSDAPVNAETRERGNAITPKRKIMILGGGPNRIGQGIEFDYCCVHAAFALRELGLEVIMVNSNPETVSTDYDTSDTLYFEPVTLEDVLNIVECERPEGVIVQFGGQTPLNLSTGLARAGVKILGTSAQGIDIAEDREKFRAFLNELGLRQPPSLTATTLDEALTAARTIGYPCLVRPSYVLGGRAMEIVYDDEQLAHFGKLAFDAAGGHPVLLDHFLEDAIEVDVDLIGDGETFVVAGILEHIEEAGIHSGDSAMVLPPYTLGEEILTQIRKATVDLARGLKIVGLMNVQYAVKEDHVYVLEVNPRASRTVPFISKAIGVPLAKLATKVLTGISLREQGFTEEVQIPFTAVKESVFPFARFPGVDILLGPEMKSTGEVMGIDEDFGRAFLKSQLAAGQNLPKHGTVFLSVKNKDKRASVFIGKRLEELGFKIIATAGTAKALQHHGVRATPIKKIHEGRPNILDAIKNGDVQLVINTPSGRLPRADEVHIRTAATTLGVPCVTTMAGAQASVTGLEALQRHALHVKPIQAYHQDVARVQA